MRVYKTHRIQENNVERVTALTSNTGPRCYKKDSKLYVSHTQVIFGEMQGCAKSVACKIMTL